MCFSTWENCITLQIHTSLLNVGWSGYWTSCLEVALVLVNWIHWYAVPLEFLQISLGKRKIHLVTCVAPKTFCFTVKLQQQTSGSHFHSFSNRPVTLRKITWVLPHHIALTTVLNYLKNYIFLAIGLYTENMYILKRYISIFSIEPKTDSKTCSLPFDITPAKWTCNTYPLQMYTTCLIHAKLVVYWQCWVS